MALVSAARQSLSAIIPLGPFDAGMVLAAMVLAAACAVMLDRRMLQHRIRRQHDHAFIDRIGAALAASGAITTIKAADQRYAWVCDRFARKIGLPREQILGKTVDDTGLDSDIAAQLAAQDHAVLASGHAVGPTQMNGPGDAVSIVTKIPLLNADRVAYILTIVNDVSELNHLRDEAEAARRLLQAVLDALPVTVTLKDRDRRFRLVNPTFEQVIGLSAQQVVGNRAEELTADGAMADAIRRRDQAILAGEPPAGGMLQTYRLQDGQDHLFDVHAQPMIGPDGSIDGVLVVGANVSDIARAGEELRHLNADLERHVAERTRDLAAARDFIATIVQAMPVAIVTYDRACTVTSWNPAAERLTGFSQQETIGLPVPADQTSARAGILAQVLRGEPFSNMPGTIHTKDGRRIETLTFGAPLRLDDGSIHGGLAIWLDVTSQRSTERQLRQATKMEAVGQLTGGMAHDFNNILAVIIGNLDELVHTLPAGDPARALATEAIDAAERGTALTRRLLAFARRQTLLPVPTDLNALILGLAPLLRRAVGESVGVALDLATAVWPAQIDPGQLESAILNLAVNGRDAMPQGGTLSVETRNAVVTEDDQTRDPGQRPGDYVRVSVIDTGVGIPPALLSRVLEPFFTTKDSSKGSGLGLSMAFGFARQSGGALRIESIEGQGTRVSLDLPRCADAQDPDSAAPVVLAGNQELILIVEDDPMLRRITARNVAALGYRTLIAADAHAALSLLRAHPDISVLFTDIVLPDAMNGFDLARLAYAQRPDLRVLFTSGFVDHAAASGAMPDFGAQLLTKPFHRAQLGAALSACLARPAPASGRGGEESSSGYGWPRA